MIPDVILVMLGHQEHRLCFNGKRTAYRLHRHIPLIDMMTLLVLSMCLEGTAPVSFKSPLVVWLFKVQHRTTTSWIALRINALGLHLLTEQDLGLASLNARTHTLVQRSKILS